MSLWISICISLVSLGHAHVWVPSASVHADKSVTHADYDKGIKLSDAAIKTMSIQTQSELPCDSQSLVSVKDELFLYRKREGWFKKIPVSLVGTKCNIQVSINDSKVNAKDEWVVSGASFVRTAEIESFVKVEKNN